MNSRDLKEQLFRAVPGYGVLQARIEDLKTACASVPKRTGEGDVRASMISALIAGGPIPEAPEVDLLAARAEEESSQARENFFRHALTMLQFSVEPLVVEHSALLFDGLADELDVIIDGVHSLGPVPSTAEEAIAANRVEAFKSSTRLVDSYGTLRVVWGDVWKMLGAVPVTVGLHAWLRPEALAKFDPITRERLHDPMGLEPSWPGYLKVPPGGAFPVDTDDRLPWLLWAVQHAALWMPSPSQVKQAVRVIGEAEAVAINNDRDGLRPSTMSERDYSMWVKIGSNRVRGCGDE